MITTDSHPMSTTEIRGKKVLIIGSLLEMVAITDPTIETVSTTDSRAEKVILTETVATISLLLLVAMEEEVPKMMSETASTTGEEVIRDKETASGTELIMGIIKAEAPPLPRIGDRLLRPLSRSPHPLSALLPPPTPRPPALRLRRGRCLTGRRSRRPPSHRPSLSRRGPRSLTSPGTRTSREPKQVL